jgi:hypothetical protein
VLQTLNTKVVKQVALYNNAKGSRVVWSTHLAQFAKKHDWKLSASEQWSSILFCFFHHLTLQTSNTTQQRSCLPWQTAHFSHWVILMCLVNFWRTCQVLEWHKGVKGEIRVLGKGFDHGLTYGTQG